MPGPGPYGNKKPKHPLWPNHPLVRKNHPLLPKLTPKQKRRAQKIKASLNKR